MPPVIAIGALTRAQLLAEIYRLYAQARALPTHERPESSRTWGGGPAYRALEAEIRRYADAYRAFDDVHDVDDAVAR